MTYFCLVSLNTVSVGQRAGLTSWHLVQPYLCSDPGQVAYLLGSGLLSLSSLIGG